jgi:hypothetical protein
MPAPRGDVPSPARRRHERRTNVPDLSRKVPVIAPCPAAHWPSWTDAHRWFPGPEPLIAAMEGRADR